MAATIERRQRLAAAWQRTTTDTARWWALAIVATLIWVTMGTVGTFLADAHLPGTLRPTLTALASPTVDPAKAAEIVRTWDDWDRSASLTRQDMTGPWQKWWLALDSMFALALGWLIGRTAARRRRAVGMDPGPDGSRARAAYEGLIIVPLLAACYAATDVIENALTAGALANVDQIERWASALQIASIVKWLMLLAAIAPILVAIAAFWAYENERQRRSTTWRTLMDLRPQVLACGLVTALLVALPGNVRPQLHDVMLGWRNDISEFVAAAVCLLVLVALTAWSGARRVRAETDRSNAEKAQEASTGRLWLVAGAGAAFLVLGVTAHAVLGAGWIGYVPASLLAGWFVLSLPPPVRKIAVEREEYTPRPGILRLVAFAPLVGLAIAWTRAALSSMTGGAAAVSVVAALLLVAVWVCLWGWQPQLHNPFGNAAAQTPADRAWWKRAIIDHPDAIAVTAGVAASGILYMSSRGPEWLPKAGSVALVALAGVAVLGAVAAATRLFHSPPTGALALVGFRRVPVVASILVVGVIASFFANDPGFHVASVQPLSTESRNSRPAFPLQPAFEGWERMTRPSGESPGWRPLLIVSAAGGGGRAAYWTLLTMNCMFGIDEELQWTPACAELAATSRDTAHQAIFAASGISGGSVGLAMFEASKAEGSQLDVDELFKEGFIDPVVSNMLAIDVPNAFVQTAKWSDRADALERAWEEKVPGLRRKFFEHWSAIEAEASALAQGDISQTARTDWRPLLLLNSAGADDGCRVSVSPLSLAPPMRARPSSDAQLRASCRSASDPPVELRRGGGSGAWPATRDLRHILCRDQDLKFSTAALLSARFPYVSPTGAVEFCGDDGRYTYLMDGGAVDSSAAEPTRLLLEDLIEDVARHNGAPDRRTPCIQPVVIQLDNGYEEVTASAFPARPRELVAPITGGLRAITANAERARQELVLAASNLRARAGCANAPDAPTFLHVYPQSHPGVEAPLGWSLSRTSQEDMRDQIQTAKNQCALLTLRFWITGGTDGWTCATGTLQTQTGAALPAAPVCLAPRTEVKAGDRVNEWRNGETDAYGGFALLAKAHSLHPDVLESCGDGGSPASGQRFLGVEKLEGSPLDASGRLAFDLRFVGQGSAGNGNGAVGGRNWFVMVAFGLLLFIGLALAIRTAMHTGVASSDVGRRLPQA